MPYTSAKPISPDGPWLETRSPQWPALILNASIASYTLRVRTNDWGDPALALAFQSFPIELGSVGPKMTESVSQPLLHSLLTDRRDYTKVHAPTLAIYAETFADVHHGEPSQRIRNSDWEQKYVISFRAASMDRIRKEVSGVEIVNVPGTHMDFIHRANALVD